MFPTGNSHGEIIFLDMLQANSDFLFVFDKDNDALSIVSAVSNAADSSEGKTNSFSNLSLVESINRRTIDLFLCLAFEHNLAFHGILELGDGCLWQQLSLLRGDFDLGSD